MEKYKTSMKQFILFFVAIISLLSCVKTIELETKDTTPKLVVNCMFSKYSHWTFTVTNSRSVTDSEVIDTIANATIKLFDHHNIQIANITKSPFGKYYSFTIYPYVFSNEKFKIEVSAPGFETVYSESFAPKITKISSVSFTPRTHLNGEVTKNIFLSLKDRINEDNYYGIVMYIYKYSVDTNMTTGELDTVFIENSNTKLFSDDIVFDKYPKKRYGAFLTFNDKTFNGTNKTVNFTYTLGTTFEEQGRFVYRNSIFLYTFSPATYLYHKSNEISIQNEKNPFAEPVQVYSNIENGFGIFGGKSTSHISFYSTTK